MAVAEREDVAIAMPDAQAMLRRARASWLAPVRERLATMQDQARLPHGILLSGAPGAGQAELGAWIAARLLCRSRGAESCGRCPDCRLFLAGNHPDFHWLAALPDRKDIAIDQVRALSESLSLRSYRGGARIAVFAAAETMNVHSFNALLKTLEEPADETYLVLAASRIERIPRTILSRCLRLRLPLPSADDASEWLAAGGSRSDVAPLLALAGGAPFLAEEYAAASGLAEMDREMQDLIGAAIEGGFDWLAAAERCAREAPAVRLAWLESWLTRSLKEAALASDLVNNNRLPWLRPPGAERKIRAAYGLLDRLREARGLVAGPANTQLLFEGLLVSLAALLGGRA